MKKFNLILAAMCALTLVGCGTSANTLSGLESSESGVESQSEGMIESQSEEVVDVESVVDGDAALSTEPQSEISTQEADAVDVIVAPVAEVTTAANFYEAATTYPAVDVEAYAAKIKDLVLAEDWETFASEVGYPMVLDELVMENAVDLLDLIADSVIGADFIAAIDAETCVEMVCDWQGVAMGTENQIVLGEVPNESGINELKIIAINGIFEQ